MVAQEDKIGAPVPLESVLRTEELKRRPSRPPNFEAENRALLALAQELIRSPDNILQKLVTTALELCRGHSAGISLLEDPGPPGLLNPGGDHFRWYAVAGEWAPLVWNTTTPRHDGPCGTVVDRDATLLFANAHLHYAQFAGVLPLLVEGLLVPFHVGGRAVGTVWVVVHYETRQFDAEDQRVLESLATFAAITYQLRLSSAAYATVNRGLEAEIVERQRIEGQLLEADDRKSEVLALLAHELRNPLAPIRNALEIMRQQERQDERVNPLIEMMRRQVGLMVRLVDDLLDVNRIALGKIQLRTEPIELTLLLRRAAEAVRPLCDRMEHQLTVTMPSTPIYLNADPARVTQVVGNLLNNACKFTDRGGRLQLSVELEGREAVIRVADSGIGIDAQHIPRLFEMFTQADTSLERSRDGLGLGLALVKRLVEMHGGAVEARSTGLGQGSEFVVRLPLLSGPLPSLTSVESGAGPEVPERRRILVVDDHQDSADSLAMLLKLQGHEVHIAHDGFEAVEKAAALEPDVVVLDIGLPRLNGYEAARRIREQQRRRSLKLVALTGWGQKEDRRLAEAAGFDAHLVKPVDLAVLAKLLAEPASD